MADHESFNGWPLMTSARVGARHIADGDTLMPGTGAEREVFLDVVPGRATIGGSHSAGGCTTQCGTPRELLLEPGAVTYVRGFDCMTFCS